jgi:branched-chain amino acid transport system permease protein
VLIQQIINGVCTGLVYGLLALGFSLAYSTTRVINFAHGEFFTLGAFIALTLQRSAHLSYVSAAAFSSVVVALAAFGVAYLVLWWLPSTLLRTVATIALSLALRDGMLLAFGSDTASFPTMPSVAVVVFGIAIPTYTVTLLSATGVLLVVLWFILTHTREGLHMRATAQDRELAASNGVAVRRVEATAYAFAALGAAAAGLLIGPSWQVNYAAGTVVGIKAFTAAMVGGLGRLGPAVLGGLLLGMTEALFAGYVSSSWSDLSVFLLLLVMLVAFPRGLFVTRSERFGVSP